MQEDKKQSAAIFGNISNLLKVALFQGEHAHIVAEAIQFCDNAKATAEAEATTPEEQPNA